MSEIMLPKACGVEYRFIESFPGYCVGNDGSVWSCRPRCGRGGLTATWRRLKGSIDKDGYIRVCLSQGWRELFNFVHQLVLIAFVGPRPEGMISRHKNGKPDDNRSDNLEWSTPKENRADQKLHGTENPVRGEDHPQATITTEQVNRMRELADLGVSVSKISNEMQIRQRTVRRIVKRQRRQTG